MSVKPLAEGHDQPSPEPTPAIRDPRSANGSDPRSPITDSGSANAGDPRSSGSDRKVVLAIASAGGHWVQLNRLRPAFDGFKLILATTKESYRSEIVGADFRVVPDCNRWEKFKLLKSAVSIAWLIIRKKPDVIVTTGAAPGYFAIRIGKLLGKRVAWIDSIANAEELSMSGQKAGRHADLWATQWEHLARADGPLFFGNVLGDDGQAATKVAPPPNQQSAISNQQSAGGQRPLKIFVTVGTDLPFDRLVRAIDEWAPQNPEYQIFAQIGETNWTPRNIPYCKFIEPPEFKRRFQAADLIVSHAGMGTILSSLNYQKPLLVMPRIAAKGEHRNEHQLATAKHLSELNKVNVAQDEAQLISMLENLNTLPVKDQIGPYASSGLLAAIRDFIGVTGKTDR